MSDAEQVVRTWFRRVWEEEDASAIDEMLRHDSSAKGFGSHTLVGPEQFKLMHAAMCALLTDITVTFDKLMHQDDWVSTLCTIDATSTKTGEPLTVTGTAWIRVADGKILEGYDHFDFLGLWAQLGFLPRNSFEQGLMGQRIH